MQLTLLSILPASMATNVATPSDLPAAGYLHKPLPGLSPCILASEELKSLKQTIPDFLIHQAERPTGSLMAAIFDRKAKWKNSARLLKKKIYSASLTIPRLQLQRVNIFARRETFQLANFKLENFDEQAS